MAGNLGVELTTIETFSREITLMHYKGAELELCCFHNLANNSCKTRKQSELNRTLQGLYAI